MQKILRIDPKDNLIVALRDLAQGDIIENEGQRIQLVTDVPAKHKFTREPVPVGGIVTLYGVPVGKAVAPLQSGERITVDNVVHYAAEVDLSDAVPYMWKAPDVSRWANRTFDGVIRPDGRVGTANYWLIIPLVFCENRNALKLRDALERTLGYAGDHLADFARSLVGGTGCAPAPRPFPHIDGIRAITHNGGCGGTAQDAWTLCRMLAAYADHPNVAGLTVFSLGCEKAQIGLFQEALRERNLGFDKPCILLRQQDWSSEVKMMEEAIGKLLREHHIEYIKWDMNRSMSDVYSRAFPAEQQGEIMHRYMLGVYALAERLTQGFPEVLFEGCAGGGGRFDAGMLCYYPQIWCSDDTDAIERLTIQHGTSFGYPVCTMGAHVSACPNHQTGRTTPIDTRAVVAMSGTFGYELDLGKLKRAECTAVKNQIKRFKRLNDLIRTGDYYRLTDPAENAYFTAWQFAAEDGSEALLNLVVTHPQANPLPIHLCFRGLEEDAVYELDGIDYFGSQYAHDVEDGIHKGMRFSGSTLLYAGLVLPQLFGDYPSVQLHLTRKG